MKIYCKYDSLLSPKKLKNHPKNRNKHGQDQIDRLSELYKYHGIRHPIIVSNLSKCIVAGHGRKLAAIRAGIDEYPIVYQDFDSTEAEYAFLQADNAIALWAELNLEKINEDLADLGPDFDINMLGIQDFTLDVSDKFEDKDADEIPEEVEPQAKLGQIYQLGEHRLMCGDSTDESTVSLLMNNEKADMVFTDPPYNTGMTSESQKWSGGLWKGKAGSTRLSHMFDDDYTDEEWNSFLDSFLDSYFKFTKENSAIYISLDWRRSHELVPKAKKLFKFSNLIVWDKVVHGLGSDYKYTHEFIHVFKKGKPVLNTHQGDKEYSDVWHIQRKMGKDEDHATKKPIELIERPLRHSSRKNDLILDLFGGSGSTLIACEKTSRKCYMMELDPHYIDVIIARWEKFTDKKAILLSGEKQNG